LLFFSEFSNCYNTKQDWCNEYKLCENLKENSKTGTTSNINTPANAVSDDINYTCDMNRIKSDHILYSKCVDSCRSRKCCFEKTTLANCYKINKDWCDEYTHACHNVDMDNILSNLIGSTGSTSNNIGSTGSTSNNIGSTGSTSSNLNTFLIVCKKDIISIYNNYNQCSTLCKDRA
jgi:hypothetical protein